jgi:hypothetical protein
MGQFLIYGLRDPRTEEIRYVGKSETGLKRPGQHRKPGLLKKDHTHKANWIRKLNSLGLSYSVVVLQTLASRDQLDPAERFWIDLGREALGSRLTNQADGGSGGATRGTGWHHSDDTRKKLSVSAKGRSHSQLGFDWTGKKHSEATRERMSRAAVERFKNGVSEETRRRMSAAARRRCAALSSEEKQQRTATMRAARVRKFS